MKKYILTVVLALVATIGANAQTFHRLEVGYTTGSPWSKSQAFTNGSGANLGYTFGNQLNKHWGFKTGAEFIAKSYIEAGELEESGGYEYTRGEDNVLPIYLQFQFMPTYFLNMGSKVQLEASAGPFMAIGLGSANVTVFGLDNDGYRLNRFDGGLRFALGINIVKHIYVGTSYDLGLKNIATGDDCNKFHTGAFSLNVGYTF